MCNAAISVSARQISLPLCSIQGIRNLQGFVFILASVSEVSSVRCSSVFLLTADKVQANSLDDEQDELHPKMSAALIQPWNFLCIHIVSIS